MIRTIRAIGILSGLVLGLLSAPVRASPDPVEKPSEWERWAASSLHGEETPVVQNRAVVKAGRFQLLGPCFTTSDRGDFYHNYGLSAGARYHFSEFHAWEIARVYLNFPSESGLVSEIRQQTGYRPDTQISRTQLASAYVFTPIYGKYAWSENQLIYFDMFATIGAGVRFANTAQPFAELGIGMSHYLWSRTVSVIPEVRYRAYREQRTQATWIGEAVFQIGVGWLL